MNQIAQTLARLFDRHRLVFWYGAKQELLAEYEALTLPTVEKIALGNNQFGVKYRILRQEPQQKYAGPPLEYYLRQVGSGFVPGSPVTPTNAGIIRGNDSRQFLPDKDNAILDGDWFSDDVTERFKKFLRVTFGEAHYEENLTFIEAALGRDIRSYFLRDFYNDHVKVYKKRPIYWLFSSGKGNFNVLIYMHRYRPDTASIVLNDYLREYRAKLTARKNHLEGVSVSASAAPRDKTQALKEVAAIQKILQELRDYEDNILYPLATQQIQIDLDDGVKVNYNKFGPALKKITGLSE
jgi:hypothetical protein